MSKITRVVKKSPHHKSSLTNAQGKKYYSKKSESQIENPNFNRQRRKNPTYKSKYISSRQENQRLLLRSTFRLLAILGEDKKYNMRDLRKAELIEDLCFPLLRQTVHRTHTLFWDMGFSRSPQTSFVFRIVLNILFLVLVHFKKTSVPKNVFSHYIQLV